MEYPRTVHRYRHHQFIKYKVKELYTHTTLNLIKTKENLTLRNQQKVVREKRISKENKNHLKI